MSINAGTVGGYSALDAGFTLVGRVAMAAGRYAVGDKPRRPGTRGAVPQLHVVIDDQDPRCHVTIQLD